MPTAPQHCGSTEVFEEKICLAAEPCPFHCHFNLSNHKSSLANDKLHCLYN